MRSAARIFADGLLLAATLGTVSGCTCLSNYYHNGFKVGPSCGVPQGSTANQWIDAADVRVRSDGGDISGWWTVFNDPTLNSLITTASSQNLSLREAGFRVLDARAQLGFAAGNLFPQQQTAFGSYQKEAYSRVANSSPGFGTQYFDQNLLGFNLAWELDFWGRFRRAVTAAEETLGASCANYDDVQVTLLGDVASNYVQIRTLQQRIEYVKANVDLQRKILDIADRRVKAGAKGSLDLKQAGSNLALTEAQIPQLRMALRQAGNRLCVLLGITPTDLEQQIGPGTIPMAPGNVATGIPAELLQRRPDVRRAELQAAAQAEQIGIAEADFYPAIAIAGTIGVLSQDLSQLFTNNALTGTVGPVFQWKILNYGRLKNNVRSQEARFQALVAVYQQTVLRANAEAEDGLATFLRSQERAELLETSVAESKEAVDLVEKDYQKGASDFNRVAAIELNLVQQQDMLAQTRGDVALGLIRIYRALGGGWAPGSAPQAAGPIATYPADEMMEEAGAETENEMDDESVGDGTSKPALFEEASTKPSRNQIVRVCTVPASVATEPRRVAEDSGSNSSAEAKIPFNLSTVVGVVTAPSVVATQPEPESEEDE